MTFFRLIFLREHCSRWKKLTKESNVALLRQPRMGLARRPPSRRSATRWPLSRRSTTRRLRPPMWIRIRRLRLDLRFGVKAPPSFFNIGGVFFDFLCAHYFFKTIIRLNGGPVARPTPRIGVKYPPFGNFIARWCISTFPSRISNAIRS